MIGWQRREHRSSVDKSIAAVARAFHSLLEVRLGVGQGRSSPTLLSLDLHWLSFLSGYLLSLKRQTFITSYGMGPQDSVLPLGTTSVHQQVAHTLYIL